MVKNNPTLELFGGGGKVVLVYLSLFLVMKA
jgi:hypothetical protein